MANGIGVTSGVLSWDFQRTYVERVMDNAAYESAHPDDTLLLAGPPRFASVSGSTAVSGTSSLLAMGLLQNITFTSTKPTQPMMMIGSGRSFFVSGKSQTSFQIGRLFCNGRNLLRVLYHNAITNGLQVQNFDDPAAIAAQSNFFINLDSELFYIPFGIAAFFRNKAHELVGSFYVELAMINNYSLGVTAGQSMILENVSGLCDRLVPTSVSSIATGYGTSGRSSVLKATIDTLLDFATTTPADQNPNFAPNDVNATNPLEEGEDDTIS